MNVPGIECPTYLCCRTSEGLTFEQVVDAATQNAELVRNWERLSGKRFRDVSDPKKTASVADAWIAFVTDTIWDRLPLVVDLDLLESRRAGAKP